MSESRMPRRLSPRRTSRLLGFRATPRAVETAWGSLAGMILVVTATDLPQRAMDHFIR